jgi:hypothetical protein
MLAMKLGIALHRRRSIRAYLDDRDPIEDSARVGRVGLERFDHEPLIGMGGTHLSPTHGPTLPARGRSNNFSTGLSFSRTGESTDEFAGRAGCGRGITR